MRISGEKINHLASCIMKDFDQRDELDYIAEVHEVRRQVVKILTDVLSIDDVADSIARKKIISLSKKIMEGSNEWEIMYKKYYEEEMNKKGL